MAVVTVTHPEYNAAAFFQILEKPPNIINWKASN